jgi:hypothetical protein
LRDEPNPKKALNQHINQADELHPSKRDDLLKRLIQLENKNESLRKQIGTYKTTKTVGFALIFIGSLVFILIAFFPSMILVLASLGLVFWGGILLYVRPTRYVRYSLLHESNLFICKLIDRIIRDAGCENRGIHLPPKTLKSLIEHSVFIPKENETVIPTEQEFGENDILSKNSKGIVLPSPGSHLVDLFREWLGKDPASLTLSEVADKLSIFLIENLELVKNIHIGFKDDKLCVKFEKPAYIELCKEVKENFPICPQVGCLFCSFIACLLTRVTHKPVLINNISHGEKEIETCYQILKG